MVCSTEAAYLLEYNTWLVSALWYNSGNNIYQNKRLKTALSYTLLRQLYTGRSSTTSYTDLTRWPTNWHTPLLDKMFAVRAVGSINKNDSEDQGHKGRSLLSRIRAVLKIRRGGSGDPAEQGTQSRNQTPILSTRDRTSTLPFIQEEGHRTVIDLSIPINIFRIYMQELKHWLQYKCLGWICKRVCM